MKQSLSSYVIFCNVDFGYIPNNSCNKKTSPSKIIFRNQAYNMNKQTTFFGRGRVFPIFLRAHYLERTYFQPFFIIVSICASCIFFPWNLNILYIHYHLIHFVIQFLYCFCMQSMRNLPDYLMNNFIIKKLCNLSLIKRLLCHLSDIY